MTSCILLSAGISSRFQTPKALAMLGGETVIEHLQNTLLSTQLDEIIVVLGAHAEDLKPFILKHTKIRFVYNKDYNFGQTSSFKTGLEKIAPSNNIMMLPVDYPFIKSKTIDHMLMEFKKFASPAFLIPIYNNKKGHPLLFSNELRIEFEDLDNGSGINMVAQKHRDKTLFCPVEDPAVVKTFNTREEFAELKKEFGV